MPPIGTVKVGRTADGYCVRVEGRGTMKESPAVMEFAAGTLARGAGVVVDLTECDYLDSTFLGCLLTLYKRGSAAGAPKGPPSGLAAKSPEGSRPAGGVGFAIAAPADRRRRLLGPTRLDAVLRSVDAPPAVVGDWVPLAATHPNAAELTRHVMDCHRRLAEIDGPNQAAFQRIADQMARDLGPVPGPDAGHELGAAGSQVSPPGM
jgi:hypothetical protein